MTTQISTPQLPNPRQQPDPTPAIRSRAKLTPQNSQNQQSVFRGLLWAEWFAHSRLLLIFLCLWIVSAWTLPVFGSSGWILMLGGVYALLAGPAYGGGDILDGCEEFSFALPATRSERYLARLIVGGGTLLLLTAINLLAIGVDLAQVLAKFYVATGLVQPVTNPKTGVLYGLILTIPLAAFACSFALSSITSSRWIIISAPFWSALVPLALLQLGFWCEELIWKKLTGFIACPVLLAAGAIALLAGHANYRRKEIGPATSPITLPGRWWLWIILFLLSAALASILLGSLAQRYTLLMDRPG